MIVYMNRYHYQALCIITWEEIFQDTRTYSNFWVTLVRWSSCSSFQNCTNVSYFGLMESDTYRLLILYCSLNLICNNQRKHRTVGHKLRFWDSHPVCKQISVDSPFFGGCFWNTKLEYGFIYLALGYCSILSSILHLHIASWGLLHID